MPKPSAWSRFKGAVIGIGKGFGYGFVKGGRDFLAGVSYFFSGVGRLLAPKGYESPTLSRNQHAGNTLLAFGVTLMMGFLMWPFVFVAGAIAAIGLAGGALGATYGMFRGGYLGAKYGSEKADHIGPTIIAPDWYKSTRSLMGAPEEEPKKTSKATSRADQKQQDDSAELSERQKNVSSASSRAKQTTSSDSAATQQTRAYDQQKQEAKPQFEVSLPLKDEKARKDRIEVLQKLAEQYHCTIHLPSDPNSKSLKITGVNPVGLLSKFMEVMGERASNIKIGLRTADEASAKKQLEQAWKKAPDLNIDRVVFKEFQAGKGSLKIIQDQDLINYKANMKPVAEFDLGYPQGSKPKKTK